MTNPATDRLIDRLLTMFGEPKTPNPAGYLEEFAKAVKNYPANILDTACDEVIKTCTFWPKPAEIIAAAEAAAAKIAAKNYRVDPPPSWPLPTDEEKARANELVRQLVEKLKVPEAERDPLPPVDRPAFEKMQRESKNDFHRVLTDRSRQMSGDRE